MLVYCVLMYCVPIYLYTRQRLRIGRHGYVEDSGYCAGGSGSSVCVQSTKNITWREGGYGCYYCNCRYCCYCCQCYYHYYGCYRD
jgi:hypothetical protein